MQERGICEGPRLFFDCNIKCFGVKALRHELVQDPMSQDTSENTAVLGSMYKLVIPMYKCVIAMAQKISVVRTCN